MKEILLYQLKAVSNQADWFVPLVTALEGITPAEAAAKNNQQNNSIEEIVHHLIYWNELYLNRFKDPAFSFPEIPNDETFKNHSGLTWEQVCKNRGPTETRTSSKISIRRPLPRKICIL